ncbi:MAG: DUF262 domain-containing protein [Gammaproteobacteria bacterium]|nr:DUF262 domain-containing protein [Gammaproteobacteria bacterium]
MMGDQTIQSRDISVADLFKDFYKVPDYQREFAWNQDHVLQFLEDIEKARSDSEEPDEYFIGSIVVCCSNSSKDSNLFELIDGQQRMTTLFLILCALRAHLKSQNEESLSIGKMIRDVSPSNKGRDQERYRLDLQYRDSQEILEKIASGDWRNSNQNESSQNAQATSAENITKAYSQIWDELARLPNTNNSAQIFYDYFDYLNQKIKLIRIETEDVAKALMIFETINDRGVGLDAMDLLKNLLFMKADETDFPKLKSDWEKLIKIIKNMREKPLRFLRYFILSRYDIDELRQDKVYKKILEHRDIKNDYENRPLEFTRKLIEVADAYQNFTKSLDAKENNVPYLENITLFAGKTARQHFILLLAGMHLEPTTFRDLAKAIENLFFVHVVTRQQTNALEGKFSKWANEIRDIKNRKGLKNFLATKIEPAKNELSVRFAEVFERMGENEVRRKYVLRYILGKLSQHIDTKAFAESEEEKRLVEYTKLEIEHIHPQTPSSEAVKEFGECPEGVSSMLGNLTLVEKPINRSLGNKPFSKKKLEYPKSKILLTRAISEKVEVGGSSITRTVKNLENYDKWNHSNVKRRQATLTNLAHKVWDVEESNQPLGSEPVDSSTSKENQTQNNVSDSAPTHIRIFDKTIAVSSWRDAMIKFLVAIYEDDHEALLSLTDKEQREPKIQKSPSPHKALVPTKIGNSGLWINKHKSAAGLRKKCREVERLLGHEECSILTFMSDDQPHNIQT